MDLVVADVAADGVLAAVAIQNIVVRAAVDVVIAGVAVDRVDAVGQLDGLRCFLVGSAEQLVVAVTAVDGVRAGSSVDVVGAVPTVQGVVVARATRYGVVAVATVDGVVSGAGVDGVLPLAGVDYVGAVPGYVGVVTVGADDVGRNREWGFGSIEVRLAGGVGVSAIEQEDRVGAVVTVTGSVGPHCFPGPIGRLVVLDETEGFDGQRTVDFLGYGEQLFLEGAAHAGPVGVAAAAVGAEIQPKHIPGRRACRRTGSRRRGQHRFHERVGITLDLELVEHDVRQVLSPTFRPEEQIHFCEDKYPHPKLSVQVEDAERVPRRPHDVGDLRELELAVTIRVLQVDPDGGIDAAPGAGGEDEHAYLCVGKQLAGQLEFVHIPPR